MQAYQRLAAVFSFDLTKEYITILFFERFHYFFISGIQCCNGFFFHLPECFVFFHCFPLLQSFRRSCLCGNGRLCRIILCDIIKNPVLPFLFRILQLITEGS